MKSQVLLVSFVCLSCLVAQVFTTGLLTKALVMKKAAAVGLGALAAKKAAVVGLGAVAAKKVAATLALKGLAAVFKKGVAIKGAALAAAKGALSTPPFFPSRLQIIQPYPYQFYNPFFMPYNQMPFLRPYRVPSQRLENPEEDRPNSERNNDIDAPEKKNEVKSPKTRAANMQNNVASSDYEILKFEYNN